MSPVEFGVASRPIFALYQNLEDKRLKEKFCCYQEKDIFFLTYQTLKVEVDRLFKQFLCSRFQSQLERCYGFFFLHTIKERQLKYVI